MPKVFGFLGKLNLKDANKSKETSSKPFSQVAKEHAAPKPRAYRSRAEAHKILLGRYNEIRRRKRPRMIQAAKRKTIKNDYLKLVLEEAQDKYQVSLASQRAVSHANLHRELGDLRDGAIEVEGIKA